jgi:hypothetical protein
MLTLILATLKLALPYLQLLESLLRNWDSNADGIDDKAADGIKQAVELLLQIGGSGDEPGVAKGLPAITAFGNSVMATLDGLAAGPKTDETVPQAQAAHDSLFDRTKVYQPKRGDDKAALDSFKARAAAKLEEIKAA